MALALFQMEPIGVGGSMEAVNTYHFCSHGCRNMFAVNDGANRVHDRLDNGESTDYPNGTVCDECGKPLHYTYRVHQQEIWDTYTLIEAESAEQAIAAARDGQGDVVHSEYNRQVDDFVPECESEDATVG